MKLSKIAQAATAGMAVCGLLAVAVTGKANTGGQDANPIGRWDITVQGPEGGYPSWIEVERSGKSLVGRYVARTGSARPVAEVKGEGGKFSFSVPPQFEGRTIPVDVSFTPAGDKLTGTVTDDKGNPLTFVGKRAPGLPTHDVQWGDPINLFDGKSQNGWKMRWSNRPNGWEIVDGNLMNKRPGNDIMTEKLFKDFKVVAEFRYPKGSNSGLYLRGRYEVQIEDNAGQAADSHKIGGVYGFLKPRVNPAKPAGEWQKIEVTLNGREVTIILNDVPVIERQEIPGITGGALDSNEGEPGPILIQGDHGQVEFRKITVTPIVGGVRF
jgi:hypothetical protein